MLFYIDFYSFIISNSSPTYRGNHQIDVGDFLLKYVKIIQEKGITLNREQSLEDFIDEETGADDERL